MGALYIIKGKNAAPIRPGTDSAHAAPVEPAADQPGKGKAADLVGRSAALSKSLTLAGKS
jgi:hypothetical protein